jgi:hypothetical protein
MRRLIPPLLLVLLALPASAAAKDGAALSPALSSLKPGVPSDVQLFVSGVWRHNRQVVPPPPSGVRPVVVLRPRGGGRALRFRASALNRDYGAIASITVPRPAGRRWTVAVLAGGRRYRVEMQRSFVAGADYAGSIEPARAPVPTPATTEAADTASGAPAWPFVLAGVLALTSLGAWRWRRGGRIT